MKLTTHHDLTTPGGSIPPDWRRERWPLPARRDRRLSVLESRGEPLATGRASSLPMLLRAGNYQREQVMNELRAETWARRGAWALVGFLALLAVAGLLVNLLGNGGMK